MSQNKIKTFQLNLSYSSSSSFPTSRYGASFETCCRKCRPWRSKYLCRDLYFLVAEIKDKKTISTITLREVMDNLLDLVDGDAFVVRKIPFVSRTFFFTVAVQVIVVIATIVVNGHHVLLLRRVAIRNVISPNVQSTIARFVAGIIRSWLDSDIRKI